MTLQKASEILDVSKKRLWRAVKSGQLEATQIQRGGRWEYRVSREQLDSYRRKYLDSLEMRAVGWTDLGRDVPTPEPAPAPSEDASLLEGQLQLAQERIRLLERELKSSRERVEFANTALRLLTEASHLMTRRVG